MSKLIEEIFFIFVIIYVLKFLARLFLPVLAKKVVEKAIENRKNQRKTILFIDEIHRWNKAQQDAQKRFTETTSKHREERQKQAKDASDRMRKEADDTLRTNLERMEKQRKEADERENSGF